MKEDKILEAVQNNDKKFGEYEVHEQREGATIALIALFAFGLLMCLGELVILGHFDYGKMSMVFFTVVVSELYEGVRLKNKKQIVLGIIYTFLFIVCLGLYIWSYIR